LNSRELFSKTLKVSLFLQRDSEAKNELFMYCSPRTFYKSKEYGLPKAEFLNPTKFDKIRNRFEECLLRPG
jgi:hypothetical protein